MLNVASYLHPNGSSIEGGMSEREWTLLITRIKSGECTPFLGAAASYPLLPLGGKIASDWAEKYDYPLQDSENLPKVSQFMALQFDPAFPKGAMRDYLQERLSLSSSVPNFDNKYQIHRVLAELPLPMYLTTNYDDFMSMALTHAGKMDHVCDYCRWNAELLEKPRKLLPDFDPTPGQPLVYHLHGILDEPESIVVTEDDYIEFVRKIKPEDLPHRIVRAFAATSLLFLGHRLEDFSFRTVYKGLIDATSRVNRRQSISVQLQPKSEAQKGIASNLEAIMNLARLMSKENALHTEINARIGVIKAYLDENKVFSEINQLEGVLNNVAAAYDDAHQKEHALPARELDIKMSHKVFNRFNILQQTVKQLHRAEHALEFLREYFKQQNISIYWGDVHDFARELRDRCEKAGIIPS